MKPLKSQAGTAFWEMYDRLPSMIRSAAKRAYRIWQLDPAHPSLRFKAPIEGAPIWSVRVTKGYRALGVKEGDTIIWFFIGTHSEYERWLDKLRSG